MDARVRRLRSSWRADGEEGVRRRVRRRTDTRVRATAADGRRERQRWRKRAFESKERSIDGSIISPIPIIMDYAECRIPTSDDGVFFFSSFTRRDATRRPTRERCGSRRAFVKRAPNEKGVDRRHCAYFIYVGFPFIQRP